MTHSEGPPWTVTISGKAAKQISKLGSDLIRDNLYALIYDLRWEGPEQVGWRNYGKLKGRKKGEDYRHCHLNSGKPRYVTVWKVLDTENQHLEIRYVGTHEDADYGRIC